MAGYSSPCYWLVRVKHIQTISALVETLITSETFHALVVESAPGLGKSTTVSRVLQSLGRPYVDLGSFATSLHIYNTLNENPKSLILLDDSAGIFSDSKTMAILKAATWGSGGGEFSNGTSSSIRRVAWGSTSEKVSAPFFDFSGKLILLTNAIPTGKETEAFLSRSLRYQIHFTEKQIRGLLLQASESSERFPNKKIAQSVARFLVRDGGRHDLKRINFRTLKLGYDLACTHADSWQEIFEALLPKQDVRGPEAILADLSGSGRSVKEQAAAFQAKTGKSLRSFYSYRRALGLSRAYGVKTAPRSKNKRSVSATAR